MSWYFTFFFLSGFCSVLYELVWLRLSMAQFGVTTPQVSIVLSMFMAGMGPPPLWNLCQACRSSSPITTRRRAASQVATFACCD